MSSNNIQETIEFINEFHKGFMERHKDDDKMDDKPVINNDMKKYDKKFVVENNILWQVFADGYSKAEVIWTMDNICDELNKLTEKNEELINFINKGRRLSVNEIIDNVNENDKLKKENEELKQALKFFTDRYDCSVLQNEDFRAEKGYYYHNNEFCKKWRLDDE